MVVQVKNFLNTLPDWQSVINVLDCKFNDQSTNRDIHMMHRFGMHLWNTINKSRDIFLIKEALPIFNSLNEDDSVAKTSLTAKISLNFVGNESIYGIHSDIQHVISWQCIGSIEYRIYEKKESLEYDSYFMNPGDIIYMPPGTIHQVVVTEPRATILFDFNKIEDREDQLLKILQNRQ